MVMSGSYFYGYSLSAVKELMWIGERDVHVTSQ